MKPYWNEIRCEFLSLLRSPKFALPTLLLPVMCYLLFGMMLSHGRMTRNLYIGYSVFGALAATMWGIAPVVASERRLGWLALKRVSPMPLYAYFAAKTISGAAFVLIIHLLLTVLAVFVSRTPITLSQWLLFTLSILAAVPVFAALGFLLGCLVSPDSASGLINLIAMPMAILSGLWLPLEVMPEAVRSVAPFLPAYHASQISRTILGMQEAGMLPLHVSMLAVMTAIAIGAAAWVWRRGGDADNHA